ncbi:hypothetical protein Bca4012_071998 [Brassica carinata]
MEVSSSLSLTPARLHLHLLRSAPAAVSRARGCRRLSSLTIFFVLCSVFTSLSKPSIY